MNEKEVKQYLRNQIDSCVKIQNEHDKNRYQLRYNNSYLRALKLSKITDQPVNKEDFKGGTHLYEINVMETDIYYHATIEQYLRYNYSSIYSDQKQILKEVFNEYDEYKDYNPW